MNDIVCIGHITQDHIITPALDYYAPGGTAHYFSMGINSLIASSVSRLSFSLVTKEGSPHFFENRYGHNMNNRQQRVLSVASPFSIADVSCVEGRFIVLGSLLAKDFSVEVIRMLSGRGVLVLDVQGFLREVRDEKVYAVDWTDKIEMLRYVDVLKVNEYEMEVLTGKNDPHEAALQLAEWGVHEVLLTFGSYGSLIYDSNTQEFFEIPAYEALDIVDATGCGDTYVMGYVYKRAMGASVKDSGLFAAAVSTLKLLRKGPFSGTERDAEIIISSLKK